MTVAAVAVDETVVDCGDSTTCDDDAAVVVVAVVAAAFDMCGGYCRERSHSVGPSR